MNKWQTYKIKDLTQSFSGGTPLTDRPEFYQNGDIPFITSSDLNQQFIDSVPHYITKQGLESSSAKIVEPQTLLLALYGATAGTAAITHIRGTINQAILAFSKSKIDIKFLYYLLCEKKPYILHTYTQGGQPNLSAQIVNNLSIYIPTDCHEQQKVVEVLETWDKAIQLTRKLIEQKELQKKYLMQQLLTGRTRLKGFTGKWKKVHLENMLYEVDKRTTCNNQYQIMSVTKNGIYSQQEYFDKQIASENNIGYKILRRSNIVFSPMNLWMGSIGFFQKDIGIVSPAYKIFSINPKIALFDFLRYFMTTPKMLYLYKINSEMGASIVRRNLDINGLLSSDVFIPSIKEQYAIAKVISTSDKQVDLLKQKLVKLEEQKKGLMQILLTGKVRLNW